MTDPRERRIALLASGRESGASEILDEVLSVFRDAVAGGLSLLPVARAIYRAQPSMASVWNAALEVLAANRPEERLDAFATRVAPGAGGASSSGGGVFPGRRLRSVWLVVTISFSRTF